MHRHYMVPAHAPATLSLATEPEQAMIHININTAAHRNRHFICVGAVACLATVRVAQLLKRLKATGPADDRVR